MKYLLAILAFLCLAQTSQAQQRIKYFKDSVTLRPSLALATDTIVADIDVVMMNRNTYMMYEMARDNNLTYKQFDEKYRKLLEQREKIFQTQIKDKDLEYKRMSAYYDSLSKNSKNLADAASFRAAKVYSSLDSVKQLLDESKTNLADVQRELKKQKLQNILGKLAWGLGGAGVGIAAASILFIAIKK